MSGDWPDRTQQTVTSTGYFDRGTELSSVQKSDIANTAPIYVLFEQLLGDPEIINYLRKRDPELERAYAMKETLQEMRELTRSLVGTTTSPASQQPQGLIPALHKLMEELKQQKEIGAHLSRLEQERGILEQQLLDIVEHLCSYLRIVQAYKKNEPNIALSKLQDQHQTLAQQLGTLGLERFAPRPGDPFNPDQHATSSVVSATSVIVSVEEDGMRWHGKRILYKAQVTVSV